MAVLVQMCFRLGGSVFPALPFHKRQYLCGQLRCHVYPASSNKHDFTLWSNTTYDLRGVETLLVTIKTLLPASLGIEPCLPYLACYARPETSFPKHTIDRARSFH